MKKGARQLKKLVPDSVAEYIRKEDLYKKVAAKDQNI
jgi:hypothetical protein